MCLHIVYTLICIWIFLYHDWFMGVSGIAYILKVWYAVGKRRSLTYSERVSGVSQVDLWLCIFLLALDHMCNIYVLFLTPSHPMRCMTMSQTTQYTQLSNLIRKFYLWEKNHSLRFDFNFDRPAFFRLSTRRWDTHGFPV